ncbi:hypothetical protein EDD21DRAFT_369882 [Dissophora ornata]|nr:hypothetical protein BGZ58_009802 [Dissophora ornata]KAI8603146.1 hypothetical protein EDD21DRAFT_369882 [Dissophora ornata]
MGSFNNFYTFISNRVLPKANSDDSHTPNKENYQQNSDTKHRRHYSDSVPKEVIQQLFPCEDRHSFNPHYQHNLHSTSPIYSTPPSLSSSPTNSSPSSTTSSSSLSSPGQKPYYQYTQSRRQQQQQQQQHQYQQQKQQQHQRHRSFSYSRQHARRQSQQRNYSNQQEFDYMDDGDLMIGYDNNQVYYGSGATASMANVHPRGSPSYSSAAFDRSPSGNGSQHQQYLTSHISTSIRSSENERTSAPPPRSQSAAAGAAGASLHVSPFNNNGNIIHNHIGQQQQVLPSISETTATMYMHEEDLAAALEARDTDAAPASRHISSSSSSPSSSGHMTAKQSLMRIARCDPRQDNWCPAQSGQWTRHYAEARSSSIVADGRRGRRL